MIKIEDSVKTLLILILSLIPTMVFSETPKCSAQKVNIIGKYGDKGELSAPMLDMWSDASGNMTAFEIRSKEAFTKALLVLVDSENTVLSKIEVPVKKNRGDGFDLMGEIKKQKATVKTVILQLFSGNTVHEFCREESIVIEKDGQGAREVKNAEAK